MAATRFGQGSFYELPLLTSGTQYDSSTTYVVTQTPLFINKPSSSRTCSPLTPAGDISFFLLPFLSLTLVMRSSTLKIRLVGVLRDLMQNQQRS